jgi:hypothetical protein
MLQKIMFYIKSSLHSLNNSKLLAGVIMLMMNVGGKYIDIKLSKSQETFIKNSFIREVFIFAVAWMGTRDIVTSIVLTAAFMILANYLFNEKSSMCIMPAKYKNLEKILDTNDDGIVSPQEIERARLTLQKADKQQQRVNQVNALNYMHANQ